jgi:hypothetical protein
MNDEDRIEKHPSFAQISASRVSSNPPQTMYGSKLQHGRYIIITICESELHRSINSDRYHDRKQLIRVRLTENQFAEFMTSLNSGGGAPCTIERHNGVAIESPPYRNELAMVENEFEAKAKEVADTLQAALKRLAAMTAPGGKASKAELNELQREVEKAAREIGANMPYMAECFEETMEKVVTEAKATIEAFTADRMSRAGLSPADAPRLLETDPEYRKALDAKSDRLHGEDCP